MTSIRLTESQEGKLERVRRMLEALLGRKLTHGEATEALAYFANSHQELFQSTMRARELGGDPFFDMSIAFDIGSTDEMTHDRVLYGKE